MKKKISFHVVVDGSNLFRENMKLEEIFVALLDSRSLDASGKVTQAMAIHDILNFVRRFEGLTKNGQQVKLSMTVSTHFGELILVLDNRPYIGQLLCSFKELFKFAGRNKKN